MFILLPSSLVPKEALLNEGKWVSSGEKDWMLRVDPENPAIPLQRHVHIARAKHTSSKSQQASWNQDGTRHDKGSFNTKVGSIKAVQSIARAALGLDSTVVLEQQEPNEGMLLESASLFPKSNIVYFVAHQT